MKKTLETLAAGALLAAMPLYIVWALFLAPLSMRF